MFSEWCFVPTVWRLEALVCDARRMIAGVDDAAAGKALALDQMEHAVVVLVGVNADVWALGSTPLEGRAEDALISAIRSDAVDSAIGQNIVQPRKMMES